MLKVMLAGVCLAAMTAVTPATAADYSADTVETRPGLGNRAGRLYVHGHKRRFEHQIMGLPVVDVDLPEQGIRRRIYPLTRSYAEQALSSLPKEVAATLAEPVGAPCKDTPLLSCKRTGKATVEGIEAEVWTLRPAGAPADARVPETTIQWDPVRRIALGEQHPDGRRLTAKRAGEETYEGLKVERWSLDYTMPGGMKVSGEALVSAELGATIAERRPDGGSRRLVNVTKDVDAKLFEVPEGYRRLPGPFDPPPQPVAPGAATGGAAPPSAAAPGGAAEPARPAPPAAPRSDAGEGKGADASAKPATATEGPAKPMSLPMPGDAPRPVTASTEGFGSAEVRAGGVAVSLGAGATVAAVINGVGSDAVPVPARKPAATTAETEVLASVAEVPTPARKPMLASITPPPSEVDMPMPARKPEVTNVTTSALATGDPSAAKPAPLKPKTEAAPAARGERKHSGKRQARASNARNAAPKRRRKTQ